MKHTERVEPLKEYRKQTDMYLFYDISRWDINHTTILFFYISRDVLRSKLIVHRHSPIRKIIISPCNYAARIICNPLPSFSVYCFPTRSIEMAFDWVSRRDRIKISGPLSRIRCSPLLAISKYSREFIEIYVSTKSRESIRDNFLIAPRKLKCVYIMKSLFPCTNNYHWYN